MQIPSQIIIGDSAKWNDCSTQDNLGNSISSPDWALFYVINGPTKETLTSTSSDTGWQTEITAALSTTLQVGTYYWQAFVTKGSERVTIGQGQLIVKPNFATEAAAFDGRTQIEKDLSSVQAAIRALISGGAVQKYKINNREVEKMSLGELRSFESKLKYDRNCEKRNQKIKNGEGDPFTLKIRFK